MNIVSVSRRTDIPAFYAEWFINRVRAGFALVPNPFNPRQITTVPLSLEKVACFAFITKDPRPLLKYLPELCGAGYRYFFQVTITGLPSAFEKGVPPAGEVVAAIRNINDYLGAGRVIWRFDPILLSDVTPPALVKKTFSDLAEELEGCVDRVIFSFVQDYRQMRKRFAAAQQQPGGDRALLPYAYTPEVGGPLVASLAAIAEKRGMTLYSCAEKADLTPFGILKGSCLDGEYIRKTFGISSMLRKDPGQRKECGCIRSVDIGVYGTCQHGCLYCYARGDSCLSAGKRHNPNSAFLLDPATPLSEKEDPQPLPLVTDSTED